MERRRRAAQGAGQDLGEQGGSWPSPALGKVTFGEPARCGHGRWL